MVVDLDALVSRREGRWRRLAELSGRRRLDGREADELIDGYQRTATDLSTVRSTAPDPALVGYLSILMTRARLKATSARTVGWSTVGRFFVEDLPAALYRLRWWWGITAIVCVAFTFALGAWYVRNPVLENTLLSSAEIQQLVQVDFEQYYRESAATSFATQVWINNAWVAAQALVFGVLGLPLVWVLWQNLYNLAVIGSLMHLNGRADVFYGMLLPHGLPELLAIFVAAGMGVRLFWSWVDPGPMTRSASLAREGRTAAVVALGLVVMLLISGLIEGFVTPSPLPTWARIGIGALAVLAFLVYVFTLGRSAVRRGISGDVAAELQSEQAPSTA